MSKAAMDKFCDDSDGNIRTFISKLNIIGKVDHKVNLDVLNNTKKITKKDISMNIHDTIDYFINKDIIKNNKFKDRSRFVSMYTSSIMQENYLSMVKSDISLNELSEI